MIDHDEVLILYRLVDALAVRLGEFRVQLRRKQTGKRFSHDNAVCTGGLLVCGDVLDEEFGALVQQNVNHIRILVAQDHCLGYVHQAACQRERTDYTCKYRTIRNHLGCLADCFDVNAGTARADFRNLQLSRLILIGNNGANDIRNLVVGNLNLRAEALRLNGQIHQRNGCRGIHAVSNQLHAACLHVTAGDQLLYRNVHQLDCRKGQNRHCLLDRSSLDIF